MTLPQPDQRPQGVRRRGAKRQCVPVGGERASAVVQPALAALGQPRERATLAQLIERLDPGIELDLNIFRDDNRDRDYDGDELYKGTLKLR